MSVHEDLLNNGENNCSFTEDEVDIMCSKDGDDACRDGCLTFQGRNRLQKGTCGVLFGEYGYVRIPERRNLSADQGVRAGA